MREFNTPRKTFIKSNNNVEEITNRYIYSLIFLTIYNILYNLIGGNKIYVLSYLKYILITFIIILGLEYILNIIFKKKEYNFVIYSLILSYFLIDKGIVISMLAIFLTLLINKLFNKIKLMAPVFSILVILLLNNSLVNDSYSIRELLLGNYNLSPIILIIIFLYLFYKKSIKYNIIISYNLTFFLIMLIMGIFKQGNIWYGFIEVITSNILFYSIFFLSDYRVTPTTSEGQILYGFILGIITVILSLYLPNIAIVITVIIGLFLTNIIDKISVKLKYNNKYKRNMIILCSILLIMVNILIIK